METVAIVYINLLSFNTKDHGHVVQELLSLIITSKEPVYPRVELILKIIIILLIIFLGFIKSKPC